VLLLAFDTATPAVTVALHDGTRVLAETASVDAGRPGELLASFIEKVLAGAGVARQDITAVAVGTGPGPYTGLRGGLVTARVLGSALGVPVHGVCTLDVIARDAAHPWFAVWGAADAGAAQPVAAPASIHTKGQGVAAAAQYQLAIGPHGTATLTFVIAGSATPGGQTPSRM